MERSKISAADMGKQVEEWLSPTGYEKTSYAHQIGRIKLVVKRMKCSYTNGTGEPYEIPMTEERAETICDWLMEDEIGELLSVD